MQTTAQTQVSLLPRTGIRSYTPEHMLLRVPAYPVAAMLDLTYRLLCAYAHATRSPVLTERVPVPGMPKSASPDRIDAGRER